MTPFGKKISVCTFGMFNYDPSGEQARCLLPMYFIVCVYVYACMLYFKWGVKTSMGFVFVYFQYLIHNIKYTQ